MFLTPRSPDVFDLAERATSGGWMVRLELKDALVAIATGGQSEREAFIVGLRDATPRQWIAMDASVRSHRYGSPSAPLPDLSSDVIGFGIESMGPDGYRRERALSDLREIGDPLGAGFVALRIVDWVQPVADQAQALLLDWIGRDADAAIHAAPLVVALAGRQRASRVVDAFFDAIAADRLVWPRVLESKDAPTRRAVLARVVASGAVGLEQLVDVALRDRDPIVAGIAGRAAVAAADPTVESDTLVKLLGGTAVVRASALDALPATADSLRWAQGRLFDRSRLVRLAAQNLVRRAGGDPAASYRHAMARRERRPVAILELGSVGGQQDDEMLRGALQSTSAAERAAAVDAASARFRDQMPSILIPSLDDPSPSVSRRAGRRLRPFARVIQRTDLDRLIESPAEHVRLVAIRLVRRRTPFERVEADFLGLAAEESSLRVDCHLDLMAWLLRGAATTPRADRLARLRLAEMLARAEPVLGDGVAASIRFHLGLRPQDLVAPSARES